MFKLFKKPKNSFLEPDFYERLAGSQMQICLSCGTKNMKGNLVCENCGENFI